MKKKMMKIRYQVDGQEKVVSYSVEGMAWLLSQIDTALKLEIEEDIENYRKQGAKEVLYNREDFEALEKAIKECKGVECQDSEDDDDIYTIKELLP